MVLVEQNMDKNTAFLEEPFAATRLLNGAQDVATKKIKERKRNLLYLIHQYLKDEGYVETAMCLQDETQLSSNYCVCDNIDLATILQEYESYYYLRFQKYPKICRQQAKQDLLQTSSGACRSQRHAKLRINKIKRSNSSQKLEKIEEQYLSSPFITTQQLNCTDDDTYQDALPAHIVASSETLELANLILREIITKDLNVKWNDVIGLDHVKSMLRETVVYPLKYPNMFHGLLAPWKAILLYGPPGTGKTMLAKAVATECKTTFFNISSSSIVSKWRGESEKLVRILFELARHYAPSTIFIDEVDSIASHSGSEDHEGTRRLRAELLVHLDGLASSAHDNVFLLATTNSPWNLDQSLIRRLEKRILVDVPNLQERESHMRYLLPPILPHKNGHPALKCSIDYKHIAMVTEGYTGCDLKTACREAAMNNIRLVLTSLESAENNGKKCSIQQYKLQTLVTQDIEEALKKTKPTIIGSLSRYHEWEKELGST